MGNVPEDLLPHQEELRGPAVGTWMPCVGEVELPLLPKRRAMGRRLNRSDKIRLELDLEADEVLRQKRTESIIEKVELDGVVDVTPGGPHVVEEIVLAAFAIDESDRFLIVGLP